MLTRVLRFLFIAAAFAAVCVAATDEGEKPDGFGITALEEPKEKSYRCSMFSNDLDECRDRDKCVVSTHYERRRDNCDTGTLKGDCRAMSAENGGGCGWFRHDEPWKFWGSQTQGYCYCTDKDLCRGHFCNPGWGQNLCSGRLINYGSGLSPPRRAGKKFCDTKVTLAGAIGTLVIILIIVAVIACMCGGIWFRRNFCGGGMMEGAMLGAAVGYAASGPTYIEPQPMYIAAPQPVFVQPQMYGYAPQDGGPGVGGVGAYGQSTGVVREF